jgi:hypothetical protein
MVREGLADRDDADADYVPVIESDNEGEVSIVDDAPVAAKKGGNRKRGRPRKIYEWALQQSRPRTRKLPVAIVV